MAILLRTIEADRYGEAHANVDAADLPGGSEGVVLIGYDSGNLYVEDPR